VDVFEAKNKVTYNEKSPLRQLPGGYDISKIMAEKLVRSYIENQKMAITIIYPSWVYGEGDAHFIPEIVKAIQDGSMLFFRKGGRHIVELNYIENLVAAVMLILENKKTIGEGYILADEPKIAFRKLVNRIAREIGHKEVKLSLPYPLAYFAVWLLESAFWLMKSENRPLLTRQSVILLGNHIMIHPSSGHWVIRKGLILRLQSKER
jgi:nucleoside-diphosphate-sugar epimerase